LPLYTDEDPSDIFTETANFDGADMFVKWTTNSLGTQFELEIKPTQLRQTGEYNVEFKITDSDSERSYKKESITGGFRHHCEKSQPTTTLAAEVEDEEEVIDYFSLMKDLKVKDNGTQTHPYNLRSFFQWSRHHNLVAACLHAHQHD